MIAEVVIISWVLETFPCLVEKTIPVLMELVSVESKFQRIVWVEPTFHCSAPFGERIVRRLPPDGGSSGGGGVEVEEGGGGGGGGGRAVVGEGGGETLVVAELAAAGGVADTIFVRYEVELQPSVPES